MTSFNKHKSVVYANTTSPVALRDLYPVAGAVLAAGVIPDGQLFSLAKINKTPKPSAFLKLDTRTCS